MDFLNELRFPIERRPRGGSALFISAVICAVIAWYFLFAVPGTPFWVVIACATFVLGGGAAIVYPDTLRDSSHKWLNHMIMGISIAVVLYGVFFAGNETVKLLPFGPGQVEAVYGTKSQASHRTIGMLLLLVIGPGEELFWRGWVQRFLMQRHGAWKGYFLTLFLYTGIHAPSLNFTLLAAAAVAGAIWGFVYMKVGHIGPGLISHAIWDAAVFVWFPFS